MIAQWECTETSASTTQCIVTSTTSDGIYNGPTYGEWLLVMAVFLFLCFFMIFEKILAIRINK